MGGLGGGERSLADVVDAVRVGGDEVGFEKFELRVRGLVEVVFAVVVRGRGCHSVGTVHKLNDGVLEAMLGVAMRGDQGHLREEVEHDHTAMIRGLDLFGRFLGLGDGVQAEGQAGGRVGGIVCDGGPVSYYASCCAELGGDGRGDGQVVVLIGEDFGEAGEGVVECHEHVGRDNVAPRFSECRDVPAGVLNILEMVFVVLVACING